MVSIMFTPSNHVPIWSKVKICLRSFWRGCSDLDRGGCKKGTWMKRNDRGSGTLGLFLLVFHFMCVLASDCARILWLQQWCSNGIVKTIQGQFSSKFPTAHQRILGIVTMWGYGPFGMFPFAEVALFATYCRTYATGISVVMVTRALCLFGIGVLLPKSAQSESSLGG